MDKQLVFIHGRAQEHKDAVELKAEWVEAWRKGLDANKLKLPLADEQIRFPYYGQTLYDLAQGKSDLEVASTVVKGDGADPRLDFMIEVIAETMREQKISEANIAEVSGALVFTKGILNWAWVQAALKALDTYVPHASAASIALATMDVFHYLTNPNIAKRIDEGVRQAMRTDVPSVVVSHSLGTVVAYKMLRDEGVKQGWKVPLFVTLGSPLGVTEIRNRMRSIVHPACVGKWFNAMDERDVVSLYPLDEKHFGITPAIENKRDVNNHTSNRHGIKGYLDDPVIARRIYDALMT